MVVTAPRSAALLLGFAVGGLAACAGDKPVVPSNPRPSSVVVTPGIDTVGIGGSRTFTAIPYDQSGAVMTGQSITWSSQNPSVAQVGSTGGVTGLAAGSASIVATVEGVTGSATLSVRPDVQVTINNLLLSSVAINIGGTSAGFVPAAASGTSSVRWVKTLTIGWALVRPTTTGGSPMGELISGAFSSDVGAATSKVFEIDNVIGTQPYFAPVVTNNVSAGLLMGVNMTLVSEVRCNCVVPGSSSNVYIGYYKLFSNSNVRGYPSSSNYTGTSWVQWTGTNLQPFVTAGSGRTNLVNNLTPSAPMGVADGIGLVSPALTRRAGAIRDDQPVESGSKQ